MLFELIRLERLTFYTLTNGNIEDMMADEAFDVAGLLLRAYDACLTALVRACCQTDPADRPNFSEIVVRRLFLLLFGI